MLKLHWQHNISHHMLLFFLKFEKSLCVAIFKTKMNVFLCTSCLTILSMHGINEIRYNTSKILGISIKSVLAIQKVIIQTLNLILPDTLRFSNWLTFYLEATPQFYSPQWHMNIVWFGVSLPLPTNTHPPSKTPPSLCLQAPFLNLQVYPNPRFQAISSLSIGFSWNSSKNQIFQ